MSSVLKYGLMCICVFVHFGTSWAKDDVRFSVGFFSGTMDPFHNDHKSIVLRALEHVNLIYVIPNLDSPHKPKAIPYQLRKRMAELALRDVRDVVIPDEELEAAMARNRVDGMIEYIQSKHPRAQIFQVMGDDSVLRYPVPIQARLYEGFQVLLNLRDLVDDRGEIGGTAEALPFEVLDVLTHPNLRHLPFSGNSSSTLTRESFAAGRIPHNVDPLVAELIIREGLYGAKPELLCELHLLFPELKAVSGL